MEATLDCGEHILVMPGGMQEVVLSQRHMLDIYDEHRGIFRVSMEKNIPIIPVFCKGENTSFHTYNVFGSIRKWLLGKIGYPFPTFFLGPFKSNIHIIIGPQLDPNDYEDVEELRHAFYLEFARLILKYAPEEVLGDNVSKWVQAIKDK
eukprot:TRINITY_DN3204_c0_g1_i3.p1 TRINITY_DN3204_c0_g1~~TRINITY_DN3204_c0_g1_i3.p1  ORF type:complete len:149 (-),score=24.83 TRINITY_DN3204_c0_g1_i3:41-487(-)